MLWTWVLIVVLAYILLIWVLPFYFVPYTRKTSLPTRLPRQVEDAVVDLEKRSKTPYEYMSNARDYILAKNHCGRFAAVAHARLAFEKQLSALLRRRGFMHCTHLNFLMRLLLAKSSYFSDDDIRIRTTFVNFFFHQYLQVRVSGQWYDVDLGGDWMGIPLGKHVWGIR